MLTAVPPGVFGDVYTTLPGIPSSGAPTGMTSPLGFQLGDIAQVANSNRFAMFVQNNPSGGTITAGQAVMWTATAANSNVPIYQVDATTGVGQQVAGVNDLAGLTSAVTGASVGGASVAAASYFWITVSGWCYPLVAASTSAQALLMTSSTAGRLTTANTSQANDGTIVAVAGTGGSAAQSLCFIK